MRYINSFITYYLHYRAYQTNRSVPHQMTFITRDANLPNLRIDIDLEICSGVPGIFWPVENFFNRSNIYLPVENF